MPAGELAPESVVACELDGRCSASCAALVYPPGGVDGALGSVAELARTPVPCMLEVAPRYDSEPIDDEDWPPLLKKRTASMPSANAPPANSIG